MILRNSRKTTRGRALLQACCATALTLGLGTTAQAAAPGAEIAGPTYVTLQSSSAVENLATGDTWQSLKGAHYIDINADDTRMLVSSKNLPEAYLVDAHSGEKLATFQVGSTAQGVQISPDGHWGLAISAADGTVAVIDMDKQALVKTIPVGKVPHNARFTADGKLAYVTLQGGGAVAVIDMATLSKTGQFAVPGLQAPHNLDLSADGKTLWVRGFLGKVAAVDLATHKVLAVIKVGSSHAGIDVVPGGKYVVTGGIAGDVVTVIDPQTYKIVKRIDVGSGPHGVRASRDGHWVYAAVVSTNKVAVIDMHTLQVARQMPTHGTLPFWVAVLGNK